MKQVFLFLFFYTQFAVNSNAALKIGYPSRGIGISLLAQQYFKDDFGKWQLKNLENTFKKVTTRIYMAETEVTNQQYGYYLNYLLQEKDFTTLMTVKAEKVEWRKLVPDAYKNLDDKTLFPHGFPDGADFPAQNMSYEGAVAYCNWLTNFYNSESIEKRKWKKVLFRLPTEEEWTKQGIERGFYTRYFLKIIEKPTLFDPNRSFKSWIYTLASNKCKNAYRDKKETQNIDNHIFEYTENTEGGIDFRIFETHLATAIDKLELSVKQCFVLRYLEDLSVKEIALIVGIPEGTVKSRLHFTTKKLAIELAWCREILK